MLAVVWGGALAGIVLELAWTKAPRWLGGTVYLALGWVAVVATPQLFARLGVAGGLLIVAGGLVYSSGAAVYALRRPDPIPAVFALNAGYRMPSTGACWPISVIGRTWRSRAAEGWRTGSSCGGDVAAAGGSCRCWPAVRRNGWWEDLAWLRPWPVALS